MSSSLFAQSTIARLDIVTFWSRGGEWGMGDGEGVRGNGELATCDGNFNQRKNIMRL